MWQACSERTAVDGQRLAGNQQHFLTDRCTVEIPVYGTAPVFFCSRLGVALVRAGSTNALCFVYAFWAEARFAAMKGVLKGLYSAGCENRYCGTVKWWEAVRVGCNSGRQWLGRRHQSFST